MLDKEFGISYAESICLVDELGVLPPLDSPEYDKDTETWDLYFEYEDPYMKETDLVCLPFDAQGEAWSIIHHIEEVRKEAQRKLDEKKVKIKANE